MERKQTFIVVQTTESESILGVILSEDMPPIVETLKLSPTQSQAVKELWEYIQQKHDEALT
mgnify:CR=1 FL=1